MKKTILSAFFASIFCAVISCSTEQAALSTTEELKTIEMTTFDNALKEIMKPENRSTPEEKTRLGAQLNDRSLDILYNASVKLVGKSANIAAENRAEKEKVISQATQMYFSKLREIKANQQANN